MYYGCQLALDDSFINKIKNMDQDNSYIKKLKHDKKYVANKLESIIKNGSDGIINGTELMNDWFPADETYHVFISHSHADEDTAFALANWLHKKFEIRSFVDSAIWGDMTNLLRELNDKYTKNDSSNTYDYDSTLYNAANVHQMLTSALDEVIYKSQCFFFIGSDNSLEDINFKNKGTDATTFSSWIMHELKMFRFVQKEPIISEPNLALESLKNESRLEKSAKEIQFTYNADLEKLIPIDKKDLLDWVNNCDQKRNDALIVLHDSITTKKSIENGRPVTLK